MGVESAESTPGGEKVAGRGVAAGRECEVVKAESGKGASCGGPSLGGSGEVWKDHADRSGDSPLEGRGIDDSTAAEPKRVKRPVQCTAGGKRPQESDFEQCPTAQSFVRCGPHHRAALKGVLTTEDVARLTDVWWRYRDDLTYPWYEKKPEFSDADFDTFSSLAHKVVDAMSAEYGEAMELDQATISNTNHRGHPPHADNVQFDSVWWKGKRIRAEDELIAAREGAYVLWRPEKTSYRSYSCSVSLADPRGYEGGEIQFFEKWGDLDPVERVKCEVGDGVAFCGCQRNIHAVTGVRKGFRLVFLVWTRPIGVKVPETQAHVCYFRPGTGLGCWLTTADVNRQQAKRQRRGRQVWRPVGTQEEDDGCLCDECVRERQKISWKECQKAVASNVGESLLVVPDTPPTSAGNSPRPDEEQTESDGDMAKAAAKGRTSEKAPCQDPSIHCPHPQGKVHCVNHARLELRSVLTKKDMKNLRRIWQAHHDDLSKPWYDKKPEFSWEEFAIFRGMAEKVVNSMARAFGVPLVLDQATISSTTSAGHPPHADNVQFDSAWWQGRQIKQVDELVAVRGGAGVLWKQSKTSYRNYAASVSLSDPSAYGGGDLEFFSHWGQRDPDEKHRCQAGSGIAFCGCQRNIHAVTGVRWGERLVLLVWTRPPGVLVDEDQTQVCYFRPGTGQSVWLTSADLKRYGGDLGERVQFGDRPDSDFLTTESRQATTESGFGTARGSKVVVDASAGHRDNTYGEGDESEDEVLESQGRWWWHHGGWGREWQRRWRG